MGTLWEPVQPDMEIRASSIQVRGFEPRGMALPVQLATSKRQRLEAETGIVAGEEVPLSNF